MLIPLSDSYIKNKFIHRVSNSKENNNQEKQSTWFVDIQGVVLLINCFAVLTAFLGQFWCRTGTWRNWVAFQKRLDIVGVCGSTIGVSVPSAKWHGQVPYKKQLNPGECLRRRCSRIRRWCLTFFGMPPNFAVYPYHTKMAANAPKPAKQF